jgi:hypothetical protein
LTDLNGREILQRVVNDTRITLDLSEVPAGAYLLQYEQGAMRATRHIQVIR